MKRLSWTAPLPWFLPSAIRIRGGLARHFASAWLFHRGIHFEASLVSGQNKVTQSQLLHFNQDLDFAVFLPDGSIFKTIEEDTTMPYYPIKDIQISALFSLIPESEL